MEIKTIVSGVLDNNTHCVIEEGKAILIDASASTQAIKSALKESKLVAVLLTHAHFDHIENLEDIIKTFNVKCYLSPNAYPKIFDNYLNCSSPFIKNFKINLTRDKFIFLKNSEQLDLLKTKTEVLFTPGHTDCGVCFKMGNVVFVGDTLFKNGRGRTDLPTSNAEQLFASLKILKEKYAGLSFYSGHGKNGIIIC